MIKVALDYMVEVACDPYIFYLLVLPLTFSFAFYSSFFFFELTREREERDNELFSSPKPQLTFLPLCGFSFSSRL